MRFKRWLLLGGAWVQARDLGLAKGIVAFIVEQARKSGRKHKTLIVPGDRGVLNARLIVPVHEQPPSPCLRPA